MSQLLSSSRPSSNPDALTIVGIGASAGGLSALKEFFHHVPEDSGLAFVVVVHLSPEHESHLAELLQPHINIPVQQVTETVPLEPNQVYVIPPGCNLDTIDTHLRLSKLEAKRRDRAPINHFFCTLSDVHDGHSVGVILTGTGSDGTLGIKQVKEQGGLTVAQDPNEAEFDGMPQSAIATGLIDLVLPLADMPRHILRFAYTEPRVAVPEEGAEPRDEELQLLYKIFTQIRTRTGRDFSRYKRTTIMRRLRRRMQLTQTEELEDYLHLLRQSPSEVTALSDDFLITVTNFFRDADVFTELEQKVIPALFAEKSAEQRVRVWSVGCSTGEEAYSLAILLLEEAGRRYAARHEVPPEIQVFASDLHDSSLIKAREAFYPGDIRENVSEERLRRFFVQEDNGYRIRKEVRDLVVFAPHNLLGDPPFSNIDLIACRNVLIYLQREVQHDVIELFHYALQPEGYLLLGTSETIESSELFRTEDKQHCLFRKRNVPAPELRLPVFPLTHSRPNVLAERGEHQGEPIAYGILHQQIVERFAPPSLLVSPNHKVVHLSEHVGRYLTYPGGEVTTNVFKLVRSELHLELRATLHAARDQGRPVRSKAVPLHLEGRLRRVTLSVLPTETTQQEGFFVIFFDEQAVRNLPSRDVSPGNASTLDAESPEVAEADASATEANAPLREMENELDLTKQRLQAITEEYETGQEEMRASNEEMQSTNEELRSTMEELETSKEELQSMNEELSTLNQENRHKVEELSQLSSDLQNLLAATDIATLFLDRQLRIMRFTPQVSELFNVRLQDRGRPLLDITHRLGYDELQDDAQRVLDKLVPTEREVQDEADRWYLTRVRPYRSSDDRIEGVVITFVDITDRKRSEEALQHSEEFLRRAIEASRVGTWEVNLDTGDCAISSQMAELMGYVPDQFASAGPDQSASAGPDWQQVVSRAQWMNSVHPDDRPVLEETLATVEVAETFSLEFRIQLPDRSVRWLYSKGGGVRNPGNPTLHLHGASLDISSRKQSEAALRQAKEVAEQAAQAKEDFLAHMSHEIRTPLNAIVGLASLLLRQDTPPQQLENLQTLKFSADQLKMLVNDILDFSKIQAGKVMIEETDLNLPELLRSLERAHQPRAAEQNTQLQLTVDPQLPQIVRTDALKLAQVMNNLLSNAVKFTSDGVITVDVSLDRQQEDQHWITFSVQDTGVGIAPDKLATIFDSFTQADISTVREYGGTGLGLSITRLLLELLGSQIEVTSEAGAGSRFFFTLPVRTAAPANVGIEEFPAEKVATLSSAVRVLLVEDVAVNRMVLTQFLQEWWQFMPDEAVHGQQAVERAQQQRYDLILMDIRMPVMDGYQAAQAIRQLPGYADVPILALTADTIGELRKHTEAKCFTDVLTKPFEPQELQQKIMRYIPIAYHTAEAPEGQPAELPTPEPLDLRKVTDAFAEHPAGVETFLEKATDELETFREAFARAVAQRDASVAGDLIHKATVLFDMLSLSTLPEQLKRTRTLVQEGASEEDLRTAQQQGEMMLEQTIHQLRERQRVS